MLYRFKVEFETELPKGFPIGNIPEDVLNGLESYFPAKTINHQMTIQEIDPVSKAPLSSVAKLM